ncbi:MAG: hypothetical protein WDN03_06605 [Rhizomicrobium sp.]
MAVSRFGLACFAAILAGGASASLAGNDGPMQPAQVSTDHRGTPIAAIADPEVSFRNVAVEFTSGKAFGRVVGVTTDGRGRASRIHVALNDTPAQRIWLDQNDLVYSRARDVIVAHDIHPPVMAVADAR